MLLIWRLQRYVGGSTDEFLDAADRVSYAAAASMLSFSALFIAAAVHMARVAIRTSRSLEFPPPGVAMPYRVRAASGNEARRYVRVYWFGAALWFAVGCSGIWAGISSLPPAGRRPNEPGGLVKRVPELRDLSDDHHTGLVLARRCRQACAAGPALSLEEVWHQVLAAFSSRLDPHFRIEEEHLLPALEAIGEGALADRIREDHGALRALREPETPSRASVRRFGELLESHIRFEEREVFEPTQGRLPAEALRAIASACRATPRTLSVPLEA